MLNDENDNLFIVIKKFFVLKFEICDRCRVSKKYYVDNEICWVCEGFKINF